MSPKTSRKAEPRPAKAAATKTAKPSRKLPASRKPAANALRAWVATADMGLGHQRAAYPLRDIAEGGLMTLGRAGEHISPSEQKTWERLRKSY